MGTYHIGKKLSEAGRYENFNLPVPVKLEDAAQRRRIGVHIGPVRVRHATTVTVTLEVTES